MKRGNYPCRALSLLFGEVQGADFDRHPARGHDLRHGGSAVRTRHGRDLRRSNRTPDRARAGTVEALCRDGGIIPGENILKVNVYVTSVEMFPAVNEVYRRYFPKDPPARIFVNVPAWNGGFDIEVDCIAAV
jgi:hypothetical protein